MVEDYRNLTDKNIEEFRIRLILAYDGLEKQIDELDKNNRTSSRFLNETVFDF